MDKEDKYEVHSVREYLDVISEIQKQAFWNQNQNKSLAILNELCKTVDVSPKKERGVLHYLKHIKDISLFSADVIKKMKKQYSYEPYAGLDDKISLFYRGVYNESYQLIPSVMRGMRYGKEDQYYHHVQVLCPSEFEGMTHLGRLVKMQHYDCPTRLLDITSNPLVGLYFACKNYGCKNKGCDTSNYGYVYVFANPERDLLFNDSDKVIALSCLSKFTERTRREIYDECIKAITSRGIEAIFDSNNYGPAIEKLYHEIRTEVPFEERLKAIDLLRTYYVQPDKTNGRILAQSGAFILTGLRKDKSGYEINLNKEYYVRIAVKDREKILSELNELRINESSLFPEIDKAARYLDELFNK